MKYRWTKVLALGVENADAGDNFQKEPKVVIQYTNTADPRKCITILCVQLLQHNYLKLESMSASITINDAFTVPWSIL